MGKEKKSASQRRQAGLAAAASARNLNRHQEQNQGVADRARKQLVEAQKYHTDHVNFFPNTAGPFARESAEFHLHAISFLNTEADTGLQFARFAAESQNPKVMARNRRNARLAYDSVLKYLDRSAPTEEELQAVQQKIAALRELLKSLGEPL